jgi:hypothetical protein
MGCLPSAKMGHGIHEDGIGRPGLETTRLFQGQDALYPPIALVTGRPQRALAPLHPKAQGPDELSEGIAPPTGLQNRACPFGGTRLLS